MNRDARGRLTASCFHDILVRKSSSNSNVLVERLLAKKDLNFIPAIQWGVDHEEEAREAYSVKMSSSHVLSVLYPGL